MLKLTLPRGDTWNLACTIKDADGVAQNITGWKAYFTVKKNLIQTDDDADVAVDVTSHTDAVNGLTHIVVPAATTAALAPGTYHFDLQLKNGSGTIMSSQAGKLEVKADVTQRTA